MPTQEDIEAQEERLRIHRRTLAICLQQQAKQGSAQTSLNIVHDIDEARKHIRDIKQTLRSWGATVEDHPDDENRRPPPIPPVPEGQVRRTSVLIIALVLIVLIGGVLLYAITSNSTIIVNQDNLGNLLYVSNGASYRFDDNHNLLITGGSDRGISVNKELPKNFKATVTFQLQDANQFVIGIGNGGASLRPSIFLNLGDLNSSIVDYSDQFTNIVSSTQVIKQNTKYTVTIQRKSGVLSASLNGVPFISNVGGSDKIDKYSYLVITNNRVVYGQNEITNEMGTTVIENLVIEEIQEN